MDRNSESSTLIGLIRSGTEMADSSIAEVHEGA